MAIQMRRGAYTDFDPAQLVAGELAVVLSGDPDVTDGKSMWVCFAAGDVKRVATWQDAAELIADQLPEAFDLAVSSGTTDAITVAQGSSASAFTVSHVAKFSDATAGLDPYSSSAGDATTLGTTTLVDGTSFFVPCVSIDTYGHVTGISYRKFSMPTTGIATLTRLGKVIPDGTTITVDGNGMISAVAQGYVVEGYYYEGAFYSDSGHTTAITGEMGKLYVDLGADMLYRYDGSAYADITVDLSDYVTIDGLTAILADYAPLASPALTGTPTAPTAATATDTTQIATTAFVQQEIAANAYELPLMSADTRGGAKLGSGLSVTDDALSVELLSTGDGTSAGPISELSAEGHAEQDTTTGKNLFGGYKAGSYTLSSITFTPMADGGVAISGTNSTSSYLNNGDGRIAVSPSTTYTLKSTGTTDTNIMTSVYFYDSDGNFVINKELVGSGEATFTTSSTTTQAQCRFVVKPNCTVSGTVYAQLELGSTATSYEPYTGGIAAPNPDYPQEIQVVRGRNLFGEPMNATLSGNETQGFSLLSGGTSFKAQLDTNTTYTITDHSPTTGNRFRIILFADEPTVSMSATMEATQLVWRNDDYTSSRVYTFDSDIYEWAVFTVDSSTYYIDAKAQLELGSTAHPYVPYGHVGVDVDTRNLLPNFGVSSSTTNGITFTKNADGSVHVRGTATANAAYGLVSDSDGYKIDSGTATISAYPSSSKYMVNVNLRDSSNANVKQDFLHTRRTRTANFSDYTYDHLTAMIMVYNGNTVDFDIYPQVELGSTATTYTPYMHKAIPVPLPTRGWVGSLPDGTCDTLALDGAGHAVWGLATAEKVLDGATTVSESTYNSWIIIGVSDLMYYSSNSANVLATHYQPTALSNASAPDYSIKIGRISNVPYIVIKDSSIESASDFVTWLTSNNVTVLYPLATATTEDAGYVDDWPEIPEGATLSIPELDNLQVTYYADGSVSKLAQQWYDRAYAELGDAITELAARVAALES